MHNFGDHRFLFVTVTLPTNHKEEGKWLELMYRSYYYNHFYYNQYYYYYYYYFYYHHYYY